MTYRRMLLNRTVWSFIAGLLTALMTLHFIASNERSLYDGENDEGRRNTRSQQPQRDLHSDLEDGRIPAKGTFLSLLNVNIVSLVMEIIMSDYRPVDLK